MKSFTYRLVGETGFITFSGEITCERAGEFRELLGMSVLNSDRVVIDFTKVSRIDPNCLQSICNTLKDIQMEGKQVLLIGQYGAVFKKAEMEAGCIMHSGCVLC